MREDVPHRLVFDPCQQVLRFLAVRDLTAVEQSSKVLTLVAELRVRDAFVSALSCLCPRRLPDRAVDCEFGSAPYCVEPPKRGVERVLANGRFSLMRAPSLYPQSSSASRFTAGAAGFFILSQSGERPRALPRSRA